MICGTFVGLVFVLSLAYVVFVLANKEAGKIKLVGQILTALIVIVAVLMLSCGLSGRKGCPIMKSKMMDCKVMKDGKMMDCKVMKDGKMDCKLMDIKTDIKKTIK